MLPRGRWRSGGARIGRAHRVAHAALVLVFMRVMRDRNSDASILHVVSICSMRVDIVCGRMSLLMRLLLHASVICDTYPYVTGEQEPKIWFMSDPV
jgi:hypothetical protein